MKQNLKTRKVSLRVNIIIIVVAMLFVTFLFNRDFLSARTGSKKNASGTASTSSLTAPDLKRMIDSGQKVVILDLRDREAYANGHIPTAKNIPYDELEARILDELSLSDTVVIYCECPTEGISKIGYEILVEEGFTKAIVLANGLDGWKQAGLSLETL